MCKIGHYQNWMGKLDAELLELDEEFKHLFKNFMDYFNKKDEHLKDKPPETKSEVL